MAKLKLLVFTSTYPRWKGDTDPPFVHELSKRLTDAFEVYVLTPFYPGAKSEELLEGVHVKRFHYFGGQYETLAGGTGILPTIKKNKCFAFLVPFFLLGSSLSFIWQIKQIRPDVIHSHWIIPQGIITALITRFVSVPFLITLHGADAFGIKGRLIDMIKNAIIEKADCVTCVSRAIRDTLGNEKINPEKYYILSMGVDDVRFSCLPTKIEKGFNNPVKILFVGRLTEKKGVTYLIKALSILSREKVMFEGTIVGHGEMEDDLKKLVKDLKLEKDIHFKGGLPNDELPFLYQEHDIFVGPSVTTAYGDKEGFGLTFVEAAMCGCLVIGCDVGGVSEIIIDGETGFLVPEKDANEIARVIQESILCPECTRKIRLNAREHVCQKYSWTTVSENYKKLLVSMC